MSEQMDCGLWQHILPVNDLKSHAEVHPGDGKPPCDCNPRIDWDYNLVVHNAWDGRK